MHTDQQKITAYIPTHLLEQAKKITHAGITDTLKIGLENIIRSHTYSEMLKLRGTHKFSLNLDELREDRD